MIPSIDVDPFTRAFHDNPWPGHEAVREAGAVVRLPALEAYGLTGGRAVFGVGRHAEVQAVLMDHVRFPSGRGVGLRDYAAHPPLRGPGMILEIDPPLHGQRRAVLNRALSPGVVRALRPRFEAAAAALVERLLAKGEIDAIADIAEAYPLAVFPDALGMEAGGRENLLPFAAFVFNSMGPDNDLLAASVAGLAPLAEWATRQSQRERLAPDGIGALIHAAADAGEITHEEAPLLVRALLSAGVDTTVNGLGAALACLVEAPDQWAALVADPGLARGAFEEAVRHQSPVQIFFRTAACDVELGGAVVPEGSKVLCSWPPPTAIRGASPIRTGSTSPASRQVMWGSGPGFTCAWGRSWRGWKARRCWRRWRVGWGGWRRWGRRYGGTTMRCAG